MGPDQVQSGYGRTGRMWAHEHAAVTPDVLVMAKGIASGLPLSAISARAELTSRVPAGAMGGTYAANPVACAAALATLDVFDEEGLVANAAARGEQVALPATPCPPPPTPSPPLAPTSRRSAAHHPSLPRLRRGSCCRDFMTSRPPTPARACATCAARG